MRWRCRGTAWVVKRSLRSSAVFVFDGAGEGRLQTFAPRPSAAWRDERVVFSGGFEVVGERGLEWDVGVGDDRQDVGRKRRESTMRCQC